MASVLLVVVAAGCTPAPSAVPGASGPRPVVFNMWPWVHALASPDPLGSPPGANDFHCAPTPAHPNPVVLVHGFVATRAYWQTLSPLLENNGYCVFALTYGQIPSQPLLGGFAPMEQSAAELAAFIDTVLAATGAHRVDLVAHSEGTVVSEYYVKRLAGAAKVDKFVALAAAFDGTTFHGISSFVQQIEQLPAGVGAGVMAALDQSCPACRQLLHGSDFLEELRNDGDMAVRGVTYTSIMSRVDELVTPYTSGYVDDPRATNVVVQDGCEVDQAEHGAIAWTPRAAAYVLRALDPAGAIPIPCEPTVYGLGVIGIAGGG
jgi:triacylglycerol esterase/lipase EstA (alpha/beta hydrolase family)